MIIVLAVPSSNTYIKATGHMSSLEEVAPYHIYADRVVILHNPIETGDKHMLGYETGDFVNPRTGICYLRTAFIAANYMGPSGIYIGYFYIQRMAISWNYLPRKYRRGRYIR
jgi:hypothetical protein